MNRTIDRAQIQSLIPHSGTMCLLDRVVEWDEDSICCSTDTHKSELNPLRKDRRLSAIHGFEYGAQATAVHGGLRAQRTGATVPPGYLAAIRDGALYVDYLDDLTSSLLVRARRLFGESVNTVYEIELSSEGRSLLQARVSIVLRR